MHKTNLEHSYTVLLTYPDSDILPLDLRVFYTQKTLENSRSQGLTYVC